MYDSPVVGPPRSAFSTARTKPKVLLVDNHREVLTSVSRMLACDFDIAAVATDGHETLDVSQRVDPDVIVLDITMPGLDGFQTAQELKRAGSRAAIVFLTMHESEEYVVEGFRSGGRGYVVKTRVHQDLAHAINRVLAGQLFAPSLKSLDAIAAGGIGHAVRFFPDDPTLVHEVGTFLHVALSRGDSVSVATRQSVREGLAAYLQARGWNVAASGIYGRFRAIDSADVVSTIMRGERLDVDRLAEVAANLDRRRLATAEGPTARMILVGEISVPLFSSGNPAAAMEVERVWNELTRALPILTVCCYPATFFDHKLQETFSAVCAEHWAVA